MFFLVALVAAAAVDGGTPPEPTCLPKVPAGCRALGQWYLERDAGSPLLADQAFDAGCQAGDAVSCRLDAELLDQVPDVPRTERTVTALLEDACDKRDAPSCVWLGDVRRLAEVDATPALQRARELTRAACEANDLDACQPFYEASVRLGLLTATEQARSVGRWCTRGALWACSALGDAYWRGTGVFEDRLEARKLAAEGCAAEVPLGCQVVAQAAMADGDWAAAVAPARLACRARLAESCTILGQLTRTGRGVGEDETEGEALLARGCRLGSADGCTRLVEAKTIGEEQRRALMDIGCRFGSVPSCAQRMALEPPLSGPPLEHALKLRCDTGADFHSCGVLGQLLLHPGGKRDVEARALLLEACRHDELDACRELRDAPLVEQRRTALAHLCDASDAPSCRGLVAELRHVGPRERSYYWTSWVSACALAVQDGCAGLRELTPALRPLEQRVALDRLSKPCRDGGVEPCRTVEELGAAQREDTRFASAVLCREGKTDRCLSLADQALRAQTPLVAAWALGFACRQKDEQACGEVRSFGRPDFLRLRAIFARGKRHQDEAKQWFEAALFSRRFQVGETLPDGLTRFFFEPDSREPLKAWREKTNAAVGAWLEGVDANGRAFLRETDLCARLTSVGISHASLQLPVDFVVVDPLLHLEGATPGAVSTRYEVCDQRWRVLRKDGTVHGEGALTPKPNYSAFEPISYTALTEATASSETRWPLTSVYGVGVDVTAGIPASDERFLVDTTGVRLRVQLVPDETLEVGVRVGLNLPTGKRNPFAAQVGIGTLFGVVTRRPFQWRVVNVWVDLWALFEPFGFAVVPSLSSALAFELGKQELAVELGVRLAIPVAWTDDALRPRPYLPAPFLGLTWRPPL